MSRFAALCRRGILSGMKLLLAMLILMSAGLFAEKKPIYPPGAKPGGPFSPAILSDGTLYVSGQVGRDKDGNYPDKFEDEVKYALDAIADGMEKPMPTLLPVGE